MTISISSDESDAIRSLPNDRHPAQLYLDQLGAGSRRTMTEALAKIARIASGNRYDTTSFPWHALRIEHTREIRDQLAKNLAPATTNKHLAALRGVLKQARLVGLIDSDDYQRAIDLPAVHGAAPGRGRALSADELTALIATCERDSSPAGARDAALLALLFGAGLRRSEVVALDVDDYDAVTGALVVRAIGSRRAREHKTHPQGREALRRWLERRGASAGSLFNPINKGGRIEVRGLSEQAIYIACRKRSAEAGLDPVSPEDLRRSLRAALSRHSQSTGSGGRHAVA